MKKKILWGLVAMTSMLTMVFAPKIVHIACGLIFLGLITLMADLLILFDNVKISINSCDNEDEEEDEEKEEEIEEDCEEDEDSDEEEGQPKYAVGDKVVFIREDGLISHWVNDVPLKPLTITEIDCKEVPYSYYVAECPYRFSEHWLKPCC